MNGDLPDLCSEVVDALELCVDAPLPPAARILRHRFGRSPLVPFEGEVRQDWGALQAAAALRKHECTAA